MNPYFISKIIQSHAQHSWSTVPNTLNWPPCKFVSFRVQQNEEHSKHPLGRHRSLSYSCFPISCSARRALERQLAAWRIAPTEENLCLPVRCDMVCRKGSEQQCDATFWSIHQTQCLLLVIFIKFQAYFFGPSFRFEVDFLEPHPTLIKFQSKNSQKPFYQLFLCLKFASIIKTHTLREIKFFIVH